MPTTSAGASGSVKRSMGARSTNSLGSAVISPPSCAIRAASRSPTAPASLFTVGDLDPAKSMPTTHLQPADGDTVAGDCDVVVHLLLTTSAGPDWRVRSPVSSWRLDG